MSTIKVGGLRNGLTLTVIRDGDTTTLQTHYNGLQYSTAEQFYTDDLLTALGGITNMLSKSDEEILDPMYDLEERLADLVDRGTGLTQDETVELLEDLGDAMIGRPARFRLPKDDGAKFHGTLISEPTTYEETFVTVNTDDAGTVYIGKQESGVYDEDALLKSFKDFRSFE